MDETGAEIVADLDVAASGRVAAEAEDQRAGNIDVRRFEAA